VPCKLAQSLHERIEERTGYRIHDHSMVWEGTCPRCIRKHSRHSRSRPALPAKSSNPC
jgi:Fe2+ or Zn2+ uptake regulation protein